MCRCATARRSPLCSRSTERWATWCAPPRSRCLARSASPGGANGWKNSTRAMRAGRAAARAVARQLLPRGVSGATSPRSSRLAAAVRSVPVERRDERGDLVSRQFAVRARRPAARVSTMREFSRAGGLWALADAARHCSDAARARMLLDQARTFARGLGGERLPTRASAAVGAGRARDPRLPARRAVRAGGNAGPSRGDAPPSLHRAAADRAVDRIGAQSGR